MPRSRIQDSVGASILLAISAAAGSVAPEYGLWSWGEPGPGLFPLVVSLLLAAVSLVLLARTWTSRTRPPGGSSGLSAEDEAGQPHRQRLLGYAIASAAVVPLLEPLGVYVAVGAMFLFVMIVLERIRPSTAVVVTTTALVATYVLFEQLLHVPLPHGYLI